MTKTKIILGLTMLLSILATTTAANANFTSVNGQTHGSSQLLEGNTAKLQVVAGGEAFTSSKAPDTWKIQDTKKEQNITKEGGHLDQEIRFEEIRTASGAVVTVNNPVVVQFVRIDPTHSDVNISKPVEIRIFLSETAICTVHIEPEAANKQLTKVKDVNIALSKALEANAEITNIHSTSAPAEFCKLAGIEPANTTGVFNAITIEHGVIQRAP